MTKRIKLTDAAINDLKRRHSDAVGATMTLEKELESIDSRIIKELQPALHYAEDIKTNSGQVSAGHTHYSWRYVKAYGTAKIISDGATDLPTVEFEKEEHTFNVKALGLAYELTTQEVDSMLLMGVPIRSEKADGVRQGMANKMNSIAYFGATELGETGLLNNADIATTQVALNAATTSRLWSLKTQAERYADVSAIWQLQMSAAKGNAELQPTDVLLPLAYIGYAMDNYSNETDMTLMQKIEKNMNLKVRFRSECEGVFTGSSNGIFMYNSSNLNVEYLTAKDMTAYADQWKGLGLTVPYEARVVGTVIRRPVAFRIGYGI
jgi:hypothetical protein